MNSWKDNVFVRVALLALAAFCVVTILSLQLEYNRMKTERDALSAQIAEAQQKVDELQNALDTPFDDEYVIKIAREKLNYRLPEEIVFYNDLNN